MSHDLIWRKPIHRLQMREWSTVLRTPGGWVRWRSSGRCIGGGGRILVLVFVSVRGEQRRHLCGLPSWPKRGSVIGFLFWGMILIRLGIDDHVTLYFFQELHCTAKKHKTFQRDSYNFSTISLQNCTFLRQQHDAQNQWCHNRALTQATQRPTMSYIYHKTYLKCADSCWKTQCCNRHIRLLCVTVHKVHHSSQDSHQHANFNADVLNSDKCK